MTVKGGTTPACAACKYQRRKCSPTCPLAPYFPADQPQMFLNVHRLFGVSNVTKTLNNLKSKNLQDDAMKSIIYESEIRARFPVHGCSGVIVTLIHQLRQAYLELEYIYAQIHLCNKSGLDSNGRSASINEKAYETGTCLMLEPSLDAVMNKGMSYNDIDFIGKQFRHRSNLDLGDDKKHSYFGSKMDAFGSKMDAMDTLESSPRSSLDNGWCWSED